MKPLVFLLIPVLTVSCASYDPAADYRRLLTPFDAAGPLRLTARDFAVPEAFVPEGRPPVPEGSAGARAEFLLNWLGSRVSFDGGAVPPFPLKAPNLWAAAQAGRGLNCLAASTLFASLAQGAGLSSRVLWLYPRNLSDENHVVVLVWDPETARWFAADPSYRTLFYGTDGQPLGPEELRTRVASGSPVTLSAGASWNGGPVDGYLHYLSKNLYRWSAAGANGGRINLSPPDYAGWGPPWAWSSSVSRTADFLVSAPGTGQSTTAANFW